MKRSLALVAAVLLLASCDNAGASHTLGITATGIVRGAVVFDANGSGTRDVADNAFAGVGLRVLAPLGADTILQGTTGGDGAFRFAAVPVGTWVLEIDSASIGDTAAVAGSRRVPLTVLPGDSVEVVGIVTYPVRTVAQVRAMAAGTRVFVKGIALLSRATFSDTTLHIVDATGAMRATRVRPTAAAAGDSVVVRATTMDRLGQRVLDDVDVFVVGPSFIPTAPLLTTANAASAGVAGVLDAAIVQVIDVLVTDTATVAGNVEMKVTDGSGELVVVLDRAADVAFRAPLPPNLFIAGSRFDLIGVLVPTGTGTWKLRPRSSLDLLRR